MSHSVPGKSKDHDFVIKLLLLGDSGDLSFSFFNFYVSNNGRWHGNFFYLRCGEDMPAFALCWWHISRVLHANHWVCVLRALFLIVALLVSELISKHEWLTWMGSVWSCRLYLSRPARQSHSLSHPHLHIHTHRTRVLLWVKFLIMISGILPVKSASEPLLLVGRDFSLSLSLSLPMSPFVLVCSSRVQRTIAEQWAYCSATTSRTRTASITSGTGSRTLSSMPLRTWTRSSSGPRPILSIRRYLLFLLHVGWFLSLSYVFRWSAPRGARRSLMNMESSSLRPYASLPTASS